MRNYFSLVIFCLISISVLAQKPIPRIITAKDFGINGEGFQAYDIEFDRRGYAYFASSSGLKRFNGTEITSSDISFENDVDRYIFALHKDYSGNIWTSSRHGICLFKGDSLVRYPVPDSILILGASGFESIYRDKSGLLHIAPRGQGHYTVDPKGKVLDMMPEKLLGKKGFVVTQLEDGSWFHYSTLAKKNVDSVLSIYYLDQEQNFNKITETDSKRPGYESSLVEHSDRTLSLSIGTDLLIHFNKGTLIEERKFDFYIIKLFVDSRNDFWIGSLGNGAYLAKNSDLAHLEKYHTGNFAVTTESHDGGLWFKSDILGLGYIPANSSPHYSRQNGFMDFESVVGVNVINDKIFFTKNTDNRLFFLSENRIEQLSPETGSLAINSREICYDEKQDAYWFYSKEKLYCLHDKSLQTIDLKLTALGGNKLLCLKTIGGRVLGITPLNLFEIKDKKIILLTKKTTQGYLRDFTADDKGNIWFATTYGVKMLKGREVVELPFNKSQKKDDEVLFTSFSHNYIWALSFKEQLTRYSLKEGEKVLDQYGEPVSLYTCFIDEIGTMWGLTHKDELLRITGLENPNFVNVEKFYFPSHYANGITKYSFAFHNKTIYIGSINGLFEIPIDKLSKIPPVSKSVFTVSINNQEVPYLNQYELNYSENDIRVEFDVINFERKPMRFSYMLEGYDTTWQETKYKELKYTNLPSGTYQLKFRSKTKTGDWSTPETIAFTIKPPFWKTTSFIILVIITVLGLLLLIFILRGRYIRKKEQKKLQNELEMTRLEMRALKSQINPHFVFNSMTSAMLYLSKNETKKAQSYLQRFMKVMRGVLEGSDQTAVKMSEEVELMRHYISLESEQYEGESTIFDVNYNDLNPEEIEIPPTLIQPYIENSIRHGLKTKQGKRMISLSFAKNMNNLEIVIADNGIGRKAAKKLDLRKSHKSFGMLISSRRISLLNEHDSSGANVTDLYNSNGVSTGTSISFHIPLVHLKKEKENGNLE